MSATLDVDDTAHLMAGMDSRRMRLLHVYSGNLYGGVEAMLATLARSGEHRSDVVHEFALCFEGRLSEELHGAGAAVTQLGAVNARRPWSVGSARRQLARLLQRKRFQAVLCHAPWSLALFGRTIRRHSQATLVFWLHGIPHGNHWTERWARRTLPDLAVCNSHFTQSCLARVFSPPAVSTISCPVPPGPPMSVARRGSLRQQFKIADEEVVIIMVARMESWKGHRLLIDALSRVDACTPWKCLIVGGPQQRNERAYYKRLQSQSRALGLDRPTLFLGQRTDARALMQASDIFCQPNIAPEPFGIVFVEALYAGLPIVTTTIGGGAAEIVTPQCGLVSEPTADAVASALTRLIDDADLRQKLSAAAPTHAAALCSPEEFSKELVALLRNHRSRNAQ